LFRNDKNRLYFLLLHENPFQLEVNMGTKGRKNVKKPKKQQKEKKLKK